MGVSIYDEDTPAKYSCEVCSPKSHTDLIQAKAEGRQLWEERKVTHEESITLEKSKSKPAGNGITFPLTDECFHYTKKSQVEWDVQKYWRQRYDIWTRYDEGEGIYMTNDAWFGVTPEPAANKVAADLDGFVEKSKSVVIDIFAGVGGNAIAFALSERWSQVIAIEKDLSTIACGQHNAALYGVADRITWVNDDCFAYMKANASWIDHPKTVIFASPPWGGPGYTSDEIFNLNTMAPYSLNQIYEICKGIDCALFLPRSSDLRQIAKLAPERGERKIEVVTYCMRGAGKALVAYIPAAQTNMKHNELILHT
ncbi:RNA cap guanine-N2 methyltransferase-domain-containing protein [Calycina marina]|uniref:Trimethylguanosine synthase n=1 Tax=Calycina marina TaxID=1763456 RepID=A0A9P7ZB17_9HELO|nr:RNA cap guanine-N2 methyltransferase-domain-containing protein [Calycina marina]